MSESTHPAAPTALPDADHSSAVEWLTPDALPGWLLSLLIASVVAAVAAATRLPGLSSAPPGFLIDEAASALYAQSLNRDNLPVFFGSGTSDVQEPFFFYVMKWTGSLFGWDVVGARLAAALCGIVVAVACALWYGRGLGRIWGLAGGLLVAGSFWQIMFSRQAIRPISMAIFAAGGLWLLWLALTLPSSVSPRWRIAAYAAAGAAFGAGFYTYISFRLIVVAVPLVLLLLLDHQRRIRTAEAPTLSVSRSGLAVLLGVMLLVMLPLSIHYARHPDDFTQRTAQIRAEEGGARLLDDPRSTAEGYLRTLRSIVWDGYDSANVNQPGRPLLDPLLAIWALAGFVLAVARPRRPLHAVALLWLAIFILPSALSSPGHPVRMLAATPAIFLFPLLAMHAATTWASRCGRIAALGVATLVAGSVLGSSVWSLHDYFRAWAPSQAAYVAFQGDVRDSLEAIDRLPQDGAPVYYSTWTLDRLVGYLAPDRPRIDIDGRLLLALPNSSHGYLVYPTVTTPNAALLAYVAAAPLEAEGQMPDGSSAWQVRRLDSRARENLPYVVPALSVADGYTLVGFDIRPATTTAEDPPQVLVTLLWRVTAGAPAQSARVRIVPVDAPPEAATPTQADLHLRPSPAALLNGDPAELLLTSIVIDFPAAPQMLGDVQVALLDASGTPLPPLDAPAGSHDNFLQLNRVQYQIVTP